MNPPAAELLPPLIKEQHVKDAAGYAVGLPDTQGNLCWLAGYESDPTRYYTFAQALRFKTRQGANAAIRRAKKTHPFKERTYRVIPVNTIPQ